MTSLQAKKSSDPRRVLVWGVFDLLHAGHRGFLEAAKTYGDELYVIVVPDEIVLLSKGRAAVQAEAVRKQQLEALLEVSAAHIDSFQLGFHSLDSIKPDVVCFGYDQNEEWAGKLIGLMHSRSIGPEVVWIREEFGEIHSRHLRMD